MVGLSPTAVANVDTFRFNIAGRVATAQTTLHGPKLRGELFGTALQEGQSVGRFGLWVHPWVNLRSCVGTKIALKRATVRRDRSASREWKPHTSPC